MKIFYIPDGHRRFANREHISLVQSYEAGYRVLIDEIIHPLFAHTGVDHIGVFLLSALNLRRRESADLRQLLHSLDRLVPALERDLSKVCQVRIFDRRLKGSFQNHTVTGPILDLFLGSDIDDDIEMGEVDLFLRSGGGLRLSGAPKKLLGSYTELYSLEKLHPDLKAYDILNVVNKYRNRYMAEPLETPFLSSAGEAGTHFRR